MLRHVYTAVMFIGALALSACDTARALIEDLPAEDPPAPTMIQMPRTLLVLPLIGSSPTLGHVLAEKMAWGLREAGYPARIANIADGASPVLAGWIEESNTGSDVIWLNFDWAVYGPAGKLAGTYRQEMAVSQAGWTNMSDDTLAVIVTESVPSIHELVEGKIPLGDRIAMVPSTLTQPSFTEGGFEAETIVVSSEGLSRITAEGEEVIEQSVSILAQPPDDGDDMPTEMPVEITSEVILATPLDLAPVQDPLPMPEQPDSPGLQIDTIAPEDLPDGTVSGTVLPTVSDIQQIDEEPAVMADGSAVVASDPMGLDPGLDEFEPGPALLPDDIDVLTPESAALVTTSPEVTMPEPIIPEQSAEPEAQPETMATQTNEILQTAADVPQVAAAVPQNNPDQVTPGVDGLPDYAAPQPAAQEANELSTAALNRTRVIGQPVFMVQKAIGAPGDGNLALPLALQQALRQEDAAVTSDPTIASHIIQCSVRVETPFAGRQRTRIVWTVTDILGQETGRAVQENDIPQGSLDQSWVPVAPVIARAAVKGIRKLFVNGIAHQGIGGALSQPDLPHIQTP